MHFLVKPMIASSTAPLTSWINRLVTSMVSLPTVMPRTTPGAPGHVSTISRRRGGLESRAWQAG